MKQPTPAPNDKVTAAGVAGALAAIVAWGVGAGGLDVPPGIEAAFAVIIMWVAAYFREERDI